MTQDLTERERIIFDSEIDWSENKGGVVRFDSISVDQVRKLIDRGYLDREQRQNLSPTAGNMLGFMNKVEEHDGVEATAHGYVVSPERSDSRVTLEGVRIKKKDSGKKLARDLLCDFAETFGHADEFRLNPSWGYCWYD